MMKRSIWALLLALSGMALAGQVYTCRPRPEAWWTGSVTDSARVDSSRVRADGNGPGIARGYMKFDLSALPDSATVRVVALRVYIYASRVPFWRMTALPSDPQALPPGQLWDEIGEAREYKYRAELNSFPPGWHYYNLGDSAVDDVNAARARGWLAVGFHDVDPGSVFYIRFEGWQEEHPPELVIATGDPDFAEDFECWPGRMKPTSNMSPGWLYENSHGPWEWCWNIGKDGGCPYGADARLASPSWTALIDSPMVVFRHEYYGEEEYDGGNVKISTDEGENWQLLTELDYNAPELDSHNVGVPGEPGYSLSGEESSAVRLPVVAGQRFRLMWHFGTDLSFGSGHWILGEIAGFGFVPPGLPNAPGWTLVRGGVPLAPAGLPVRHGGWLAAGANSHGSVVYVGKGNKTTDFYSYHPDGDSWFTLAPMPCERHPNPEWQDRLPQRGCRGAADSDGRLWVVQGNKTCGFWSWRDTFNVWYFEPDVPFGPGGKPVKEGADVVYADHSDTGWVYLMKGRNCEFYRFNTVAGRWDALESLPFGTRPKWKEGSFLAYDGHRYIYAHQARYDDESREHHHMFRFDTYSLTWNAALTGMPVSGQHGARVRRKKSKDGSGGAWCRGALHALKGGNTQMFYRYDPASDSWTELDTIPRTPLPSERSARVKQGGDLATVDGWMLLALKGNKTRELWNYVPVLAPASQGDGGGIADNGGLQAAGRRLQIGPNPASGFTTVRYDLPKAGPVTITVYEATGRTVQRVSTLASRHSSLPLDLRKVPAGVYLVKVEADGFTGTQKLVVQH